MLCLEDHRLVAGRMSAIDAAIRTWPERFKSDAKFATDEIAYEILEIGRGEGLETVGQLWTDPARCHQIWLGVTQASHWPYSYTYRDAVHMVLPAVTGDAMLDSVYILETLDPEDFFERRLDGHAANEILKILDVTTEYRIAFTKPLVERAIAEAAASRAQVLHFSSHGNDTGVFLTNGKKLSWKAFVERIKPAAGPDKALVMATCGGGDRELTTALTAAGVVFGWVFGSTAEKVSFSDCCLAWSILYNRLCDHGFDKAALMTTLKAINAAIDGDLVYRRWTGKKYLRFPAEK